MNLLIDIKNGELRRKTLKALGANVNLLKYRLVFNDETRIYRGVYDLQKVKAKLADEKYIARILGHELKLLTDEERQLLLSHQIIL